MRVPHGHRDRPRPEPRPRPADVDNTPSQRLMEKVGMTREGVLRQSRVERGTPVDEVWYGILRSEWGARSAAPRPVP